MIKLHIPTKYYCIAIIHNKAATMTFNFILKFADI